MDKEQELDPHIAYCGLDCSGCDVFRATAFDDDKMRQDYADQIKLNWKIEIDPAGVSCYGCRDERPKTGFCASCEVRACTKDRGLDNCATCEDYGCDKMLRVHTAMVNVGKAIDGVATARLNLEEIRRQKGIA